MAKKKIHFTLTKSSKEISTLLRRRPLENITALTNIEKTLKRQRKFVFRMPKPGTPVVVLLSGGADSVSLTYMLLEKYKLHIFPLFLKRSQQRVNKEIAAAQYYVEKMKQQYPGMCEDLFLMDSPIPPNKIRHQITLHSDEIKEPSKTQLKGIPVYLLSLTGSAVQFAHYLEITQKVKARTLFYGFVASDGECMAYETLTALRTVTLSTCLMENDFSWQITSLALEKELGHFLSKFEVFRWAADMQLDLSKTWSCYYPFTFHCGSCVGCLARREHTEFAGLRDDIIYKAPSAIEKVFYRIKRKMYAEYRKLYF